MSQAGSESNTAYVTPRGVGPVLQNNPTPPTPAPATIAAAGTWVSGVIPSDGYKALAVGATLSQAGSISIQRYLDVAGLIPVGAPITAALVASTPNAATVNDGVAYAAFQITITNSGGSTGNLTNVGILQAAA